MPAAASEKKWFIYLSDHHEGPFALDEIHHRLSQGLVTPANYVWCEGMADWRVMTEVNDFEPILGKEKMRSFDHTRPQIRLPNQGDRTGTHSMVIGKLVRKGGPKSFRWFALVCFLLLGAGVGLLYATGLNESTIDPIVRDVQKTFQTIAQNIPIVRDWISPIAPIEDISRADYEELKAAARHDPTIPGSAIAIALPEGKSTSPTFYVAANLADQSEILVYAEGVADSLIGTMSAFGQQSAKLTQKIGKTGALRGSDGKALPIGQYTVYAFEGTKQPEATRVLLAGLPPTGGKLSARLPKGVKILTQKTYFLGGTNDSAYQQKLREYHEKLKAQATREIQELKQFISTFERQFDQLHTEVSSIKSQPNKVKRAKAWKAFSAQWTKLSGALGKTFSGWTPDVTTNKYFYSTIYDKVPGTYQKLLKVYNAQDASQKARANLKSLDTKITDATNELKTAINEVKTLITRAENLAPSPGGLPQKDGL